MHGMECAMFMGSTLSGGEAALMQEWAGKPNDKFSLMFSACNFESPIQWTGGNLIIADSDLNFWKDHLSVGPDANAVLVADSRFKGKSRIDNMAGDRFKMNEPREPYIHVPDYVYDVNRISTYKPPQTDSVFVRAGDGKADDTQRIQLIGILNPHGRTTTGERHPELMLRSASRCVLKNMQAAPRCEEAFNDGNSGDTKKELAGKGHLTAELLTANKEPLGWCILNRPQVVHFNRPVRPGSATRFLTCYGCAAITKPIVMGGPDL